MASKWEECRSTFLQLCYSPGLQDDRLSEGEGEGILGRDGEMSVTRPSVNAMDGRTATAKKSKVSAMDRCQRL